MMDEFEIELYADADYDAAGVVWLRMVDSCGCYASCESFEGKALLDFYKEEHPALARKMESHIADAALSPWKGTDISAEDYLELFADIDGIEKFTAQTYEQGDWTPRYGDMEPPETTPRTSLAHYGELLEEEERIEASDLEFEDAVDLIDSAMGKAVDRNVLSSRALQACRELSTSLEVPDSRARLEEVSAGVLEEISVQAERRCRRMEMAR